MSEVQDRALRIFRGETESKPVAETRRAALAVNADELDAGEPDLFSSFVLEHAILARDLTEQLMDRVDTDGVDAAREELLEVGRQHELPGLEQHVLALLASHHPQARQEIKIPTLEKRQPALVQRSRAVAAARTADGGASPPEDALDFWREDPLLNEHHEHWHIVYPTAGRPRTRQLGDRHGELFAWMHQQMLARYEAERRAVGAGSVDPFADYSQSLGAGYDPGPLQLRYGVRDGQPLFYPFRARPADASLSPRRLLTALGTWRDRMLDAARRGVFVFDGQSVTVDADNLGSTEESTIGSVDSDTFGSHHNQGHNVISSFDNQPRERVGVIATTATAVRDPAFWRWHTHVDDVFETWRATQTRSETHFDDEAPPVTIHRPLLITPAGLPGGQDWDDTGVLEALLEEAVGGGRFTTDLPSGDLNVSLGRTLTLSDELRTEMRQRKIVLRDDNNLDVEDTIDYLSHEDFAFVLRIANNDLAAEQVVTVRLFIAPQELDDERNAYIEMDRFKARLAAGEQAVIVRRAEDSSVVRKPARKATDLDAGRLEEADSWCDCGWPYTLLLPRGTVAGMHFSLFAMCSPGDDLDEPQQSRCTSLSYCGLKDSVYPDSKPMGYPFDRDFPGDGIQATAARLPTMVLRDLTIRLTARS